MSVVNCRVFAPQIWLNNRPCARYKLVLLYCIVLFLYFSRISNCRDLFKVCLLYCTALNAIKHNMWTLMLTTEQLSHTIHSELLPENIAGWSLKAIVRLAGPRWVCYSCRLRGPKSVHSGKGLPLLALRHLVSLPVSTPLWIVNRCWSC